MRPVCSGATLLCSCATAPGVLLVGPNGFTLEASRAVATIMDCAPLVNIPPLPGCTAPLNPHPSIGVRPCLPAFAGAWSSPPSGMRLNGVPLLDDSATLFCAYGGVLRIVHAGQEVCRRSPG